MMMARMIPTPMTMMKTKIFISPHHVHLFYIPRATQTSCAGHIIVIVLSARIPLRVSSLPLVSPDHRRLLTLMWNNVLRLTRLLSHVEAVFQEKPVACVVNRTMTGQFYIHRSHGA